MTETSTEDRERELRALLNQFATHPERDWHAERERAAVLQRLLAAGHAND